jgi:hypothetical protein
MAVESKLSLGIPIPKAKGFGVVIPPGGITEQVAADLRRQRAERLANGETDMAAAIARSLQSRGFAAEEEGN